jgi:hypothetical protein
VVLMNVFWDGRVLLVRENIRRELSGIVQGEAGCAISRGSIERTQPTSPGTEKPSHSMRRESVEEEIFRCSRARPMAPACIAGAGL